MSVLLGTDIIEIARIRKAIERNAFLERVYTKEERHYADGRGAQRAASYAARFAGKEAIMKALGTGLRGGSLLELEILPDEMGKPCVTLKGTFLEIARQKGISRAQISLSHAREYATAVCIMERKS